MWSFQAFLGKYYWSSLKQVFAVNNQFEEIDALKINSGVFYFVLLGVIRNSWRFSEFVVKDVIFSILGKHGSSFKQVLAVNNQVKEIDWWIEK